MEVESCPNSGISVGMTDNPEPSRQKGSSSNQASNLPKESEADVRWPRKSAEIPSKVLNAIWSIARYQKTTSKRQKQHAALLTSSDTINKLRANISPIVASNHNVQNNRRLMKKV